MHRINIPAISFHLIAIDCALSFDSSTNKQPNKRDDEARSKYIMSLLFDRRFLIAALAAYVRWGCVLTADELHSKYNFISIHCRTRSNVFGGICPAQPGWAPFCSIDRMSI